MTQRLCTEYLSVRCDYYYSFIMIIVIFNELQLEALISYITYLHTFYGCVYSSLNRSVSIYDHSSGN